MMMRESHGVTALSVPVALCRQRQDSKGNHTSGKYIRSQTGPELRYRKRKRERDDKEGKNRKTGSEIGETGSKIKKTGSKIGKTGGKKGTIGIY